MVYENIVIAPTECDSAPAPWRERGTDRYHRAEADRATCIETGARPDEHNARVVIRHVIIAGRDRHNFDVPRASGNNSSVLAIPKVSVIISLLPHALHSVHDIAAL